MSGIVELVFRKPHLSIDNFSSVKLPDLAVVCGKNGNGKSHLLDAIYSGMISAMEGGVPFTSLRYDSTPRLTAKFVTLANLQETSNAMKDAFVFLDDIEILFAAVEAAKVAEPSKATQVLISNEWKHIDRETMLTALRNRYHNPNMNFTGAIATKYQELFAQHLPAVGRARSDSFVKVIPPIIFRGLTIFNAATIKDRIRDFIEYQTFMKIDVSSIFYRYFEESQNNKYLKGAGDPHRTDEQFVEEFGLPPWEEVNTLLSSYGFRHNFIPPDSIGDARATKGYTARLVTDTGKEFDVDTLSTGEHVILSLLLSAYAVQQEEKNLYTIDAPELVLFDELDAHLHPSLTQMMFKVIQESLIQKLNLKVILTTHSPTTVAMAPEGSVYKLVPGATHELIPTKRSIASRELTDGFVQVLDNSQIVIVEGKYDPPFYRLVEKALRAEGFLTDIPTLHFIPASQGDDPSTGGGKKSATDWATKLNETNLPNVHALVDRDRGTIDAGVIKILQERYAVENFILDPLSLAITLIIDQKLHLIKTAYGTQYAQVSQLYTARSADLQAVVDDICSFIEKNSKKVTAGRKLPAKYLNGMTLNLPNWAINERGHDLVEIVRDALKMVDAKYNITKGDAEPYNFSLGYLMKHLYQYPNFFSIDLLASLEKFHI